MFLLDVNMSGKVWRDFQVIFALITNRNVG